MFRTELTSGDFSDKRQYQVLLIFVQWSVAELIREGENGFTFETGNRQFLKNKIKWCLDNKTKLNEMSKKTAQSLVGLSQNDYIGKLDELYQGISL